MKAKLENNIVKIYNSLPTRYLINGMPHNLSKLPVGIQEDEGFYEVIVPTITQYQRLEDLIPSDFNGTNWVQRVYDFTAQEVIDYDELQIENAISQDLNTKQQDGETFFVQVRNKIRRFYNDGNINQTQYKSIRTSLQPVLQPLRYGDWDVAQDNINAISRPSGQLGNLYDFLKNKIDTYIIDNY